MLIIAVTGGIGSGKSTVADLFKAKGIPAIDTDQVAHQIVQPGSPILQKIITEFGQDYLDNSGQLKRKQLGQLIFTDELAKARLEAIMHPAIHAEVLAQLNKLDSPYCLILIPLLAHSRYTYPYDRVLVVDTPEQLRISRTSQRDQQSPDLVRQIITTQPTRSELIAMADDILDNSGDLSALRQAVCKLHKLYLNQASQLS